eukprot:726752-Pelagomonas_calceolata.AAC.5
MQLHGRDADDGAERQCPTAIAPNKKDRGAQVQQRHLCCVLLSIAIKLVARVLMRTSKLLSKVQSACS